MKHLIICLTIAILSMVVMNDMFVRGDVYGHAPPFSNNRNNEEGTNRDNANRLFNSQNNDKGGYCRGGMFNWYEKSYLPIEWTNQHGCGSDQTKCTLILQYMCTDINAGPANAIRDGVVTTTIPNDITQVDDKTGNDYTYGLHESYNYYQTCTNRTRNRGLFTANQNPGSSSRSTRQQPGTTRYGFECPEERDYYPYWQPSPWKDIAIFTTEKSRCKYYKKESENVSGREYCRLPGASASNLIPVTSGACEARGGTWESGSSHDIKEPGCYEAPWNHVNHLGIQLANGKYNMYNWSLPDSSMEPCIATDSCRCVLRLRYNISNAEVAWDLDSGSNGPNSPVLNDPLWTVAGGAKLTIEMNEQQYGRTFQDRTHAFNIISRPKSLKNAKIWNLLVKGKRGNIVQAYPAQEYQFSPSQLHMRVNEYIHFQWTGCDTNPAGNTGNGRAKTDRSNIVQIVNLNHNTPMFESDINKKNALFPDEDDRNKMAYLGQTNCKSEAELNALGADAAEQDEQNCFRLNAAPKHFDGGVYKMSRTGSYYYMSTRNNNFSNRDQKGAIHVDPLLPAWAIALIVIGGVALVGAATTAGGVFYARRHPHSGAARFLQRVPVVKKWVPYG